MSTDRERAQTRLTTLAVRLVLLLVVTAIAGRAAEAPVAADAPAGVPLFHLGFEEYVPGQAPGGWSVSWGEQGDHLVLVSNLQAASGARALLFDRTVGTVTKPCQLQWFMPGASHTRPWTELSFCVLIDGRASQSQFEVSLGDCHPRRTVKVVFSLRGWGPSIHLYPNVLAHSWTQNWEGKREICQWQTGAWHRIRLFLPSQGTDLAAVHGLVERRGADGTWAQVGKPQRVPAQALQDPTLHGYLCTAGTVGYALFLDDLQARELDALPHEAVTVGTE